jgi:hypothetical protein
MNQDDEVRRIRDRVDRLLTETNRLAAEPRDERSWGQRVRQRLANALGLTSPKSRRFLASVTVVGLCLALVLIAIIRISNPGRQPTATDEIRNDPLTIAVGTNNRFAERSWFLSVNSSGRAVLTVGTASSKTRHLFEVVPEQLAKLRAALLDERFFDLAAEYGKLASDGTTHAITITAGGKTQTVRLHCLGNVINQDEAHKKEAARAVRVLLVIHGWFNNPNLVNLRPYYEDILRDAEGGE